MKMLLAMRVVAGAAILAGAMRAMAAGKVEKPVVEKPPQMELVRVYKTAMAALGDERANYENLFEEDPKTKLPARGSWDFARLASALMKLEKRDAALEFVDQALVLTGFSYELKDWRWELADKENDDAAKERIYRTWLDWALAKTDDEPMYPMSRPKFGRRLLPEYLKKLEASPKVGKLFDYLTFEFMNWPENLDICAARLKGAPDDMNAASCYLHTAVTLNNFELLLDDAKLPKQVTQLEGRIDLARAVAKIGLKQKVDASAVLAMVDGVKLPEKMKSWDPLLWYFIHYSGVLPSSRNLLSPYRDDAKYKFARLVFLAAAGDVEGTKKYAARILAEDSSEAARFGCADAYRAIGEKELAEKTFDAGEAAVIKALEARKNETQAEWRKRKQVELYLVADYYRQWGRAERFAGTIGKAANPASSEMIGVYWELYDIGQLNGGRAEAIAMFEALKARCQSQWSFAAAYGNVLKEGEKYEAALEQFAIAERTPFDYARAAGASCVNVDFGNECKLRKLEEECFAAMKKEGEFEGWLKEHQGGGGERY